MENISKTFGIYQIKNNSNEKIYIGSTICSFSKRWSEWKRAMRKNRCHNKHLQRAWNLYGEDSFQFSILEVIDNKDKVLEREQFYIDSLKPEYNLNPKADRPPVAIKGQESRMGKTPWNKGDGSYMKGEKNHFFGKKHTEESKTKMAKAKLGKTNSSVLGKRKGTSQTSLWRYEQIEKGNIKPSIGIKI